MRLVEDRSCSLASRRNVGVRRSSSPAGGGTPLRGRDDPGPAAAPRTSRRSRPSPRTARRRVLTCRRRSGMTPVAGPDRPSRSASRPPSARPGPGPARQLDDRVRGRAGERPGRQHRDPAPPPRSDSSSSPARPSTSGGRSARCRGGPATGRAGSSSAITSKRPARWPAGSAPSRPRSSMRPREPGSGS